MESGEPKSGLASTIGGLTGITVVAIRLFLPTPYMLACLWNSSSRALDKYVMLVASPTNLPFSPLNASNEVERSSESGTSTTCDVVTNLAILSQTSSPASLESWNLSFGLLLDAFIKD